jgi:hypothetical protein
MRCLFVCLAACGSDTVGSIEESLSDAAPIEIPGDAATTLADAATPDGAPPAPDAPPLTLCEEATLHSDLAWIEAKVFVPRCASCHGGANPDVGLSLAAGQARSNLVGVGSSTQSGWVRVVAGSPSTSYLMVALGRASGPPPPDGFMPLGSPALCVEIHQAIERWIAAGAP